MNKLISRRQLLALAFLGMLSPMTRLLPALPAAAAGNMAFLAPVAALPVCWLYLRVIESFTAMSAEGEGMTELLHAAWGRKAGSLAALTAAVWLTIYCGFTLRSAAERLLSAVYTTGRPWLFSLICVGMAVIAARGSLCSLGRCARLCLILVVPILVPLLVLVLTNIRSENLLPVAVDELPKLLPASIPIINIISYYGYFTFLYGRVERNAEDAGQTMCFGFVLLGVMTALVTATVGGMSAAICERGQSSFFVLVRNTEIFGSALRIEALVLGIWIVSDFLFLAGQIMIASEILAKLLGVMKREDWCIVIGVFAFAVSILAKSAFTLLPISKEIIPYTNMILMLAILPAAWITLKIKQICRTKTSDSP